MTTKAKHKLDYNFIAGSTLLIVNSIVGLADFVQGGVMWPLLVVADVLQIVALLVTRQ